MQFLLWKFSTTLLMLKLSLPNHINSIWKETFHFCFQKFFIYPLRLLVGIALDIVVWFLSQSNFLFLGHTSTVLPSKLSFLIPLHCFPKIYKDYKITNFNILQNWIYYKSIVMVSNFVTNYCIYISKYIYIRYISTNLKTVID